MSSIIKVNTVQDTDGNNIINENANTITIGASGDTISIPAGATLANSGTATGFASIAWQSSIVTAATLNADAGKGYWINTTSNACTVTFPGSASVGDRIILTDYLRTWGSNNVTINQNGLKFQGYTSPNPLYSTDGQSVDVVYSGATQGWIPNSDDVVSWETPQAYTIEYLVVAGGGTAAFSKAGGGGAGGMRTNFGGTALTINGGTTYTATVGGGGAAGTSNPGPNGNASSLAGSDITNVTTVGGGGGGQDNGGAKLGQDGGSGGGGGFPGSTGGSGTAGEGNDGGSGYPDGTAGGGGGGGKGAVGADATSNSGGAGGIGAANSITGSSVYYAGGGGGTTETPGTQGAGGNGGGGNAIKNGAGGNGTANTGGGGGAANDGGPSGGGGSGVVIITMADASYSGTVTGSPTVATNVGGTGKTSVTFTGTGTYVG
jgi:hypothetical protein